MTTVTPGGVQWLRPSQPMLTMKPTPSDAGMLAMIRVMIQSADGAMRRELDIVHKKKLHHRDS